MLPHLRRARNLARYHRIVTVFARHGFGSILEALHVDRYTPIANPKVLRRSSAPDYHSPAEHLRLALEELGPTFIKLGQIFSTRLDLFPAAFIVELSKLQDAVPPAPWESVALALTREYGRELEQVFAWIDPEPLAAASLAQVHPARLWSGEQVAVKVQRPNILRTIQADLEILNDMAGLAQRTPWGQLYNPIEMVAHFARTLYNELDYRKEAANAEKFHASFASEPHLYVPRVYWDYTTQRVLVLEKLEGIKIDQWDALAAAQVDRRQIATYAARIIIKEIIEDGFFHADPHPGNFMVMPNRRLPDGTEVDITVGAMDFGMVGHVSKTDRANLLQIYSLAAQSNTQGMVDLLHRIGALGNEADFDGLGRELDRVLTQYRGMPPQHFQTRRVMEDLMQVAYHYQVSLPPDMWLLFKTLLMMDGLARQLDPDFNVFETFTPHLQRLRTEAYLPWVWGPAVLAELEPLLYALRDIPSMGENLLRGLQRGRLPFAVKFGANKETLDRLDRVSTRLALSILVAAFILGLALLLPAASTNRTAELLVGIGFVAALGLGVWIVFSILRAGR